ncbi:MAG TPA: methyltransferase domain-containing protein [Clostridiales bacterium]|nr:methyltransferase domain-containing protein [Clostridiales bacterium]
MSSYNDFAEFYDGLNLDVSYPERARYILTLFEKYDRKPSLLLDLACGTGGFSIEFAKSGIEVIGVDSSAAMLSKAYDKAQKLGLNILFLCQKAEDLDLYGTVDGAVCCMDSVNHIIDYAELCRSFKKVALFLEKDRLFIFDVNTEYKHKEILSNNTFILENEDVFCAWQNQCSDNGVYVDMQLDFFKRTGQSSYERFTEYITERVYLHSELVNALNESGFLLLDVLEDMSFTKPGINSERNFYIAKRV